MVISFTILSQFKLALKGAIGANTSLFIRYDTPLKKRRSSMILTRHQVVRPVVAVVAEVVPQKVIQNGLEVKK
jgi:hypothetical protein